MKVLLVAPSESEVYGSFIAPDYPPLGLAYLEAVLLKAGHKVKTIDMDANRSSEKDLIVELQNNGYGLVGITTTTPTFKNAVKLTKLVKEKSKVYTALGGIHVTLAPEESVKIETVDFVVKGEGELTILVLVKCLESGGDLKSIDGLYYKSKGSVMKNRDRALIQDLDELPFPTRYLLHKYNYTYPDALLKPAIPIITSRGCPGECTFCNVQGMFSRKFRMRSPINVVDEIEYLIRNLGAKEIHIWDDNFVTNKARVFQIRDEIKRRNIKTLFSFPNGIRIDYVNDEVLKALKDMGTYSLAFGVESGSQIILNKINKETTLEMIAKAFSLAKKYKLQTWAFFIIGLPGEDKASIQKTIEFAKKLNPDVVKFHMLKPFPGTKIFDELKNANLILDYDYDNYGIHKPPVHRLPTIDADELLALQKLAYRSFYLRPSIILKHLIRAKSLDRLITNFKLGLSILFRMR